MQIYIQIREIKYFLLFYFHMSFWAALMQELAHQFPFVNYHTLFITLHKHAGRFKATSASLN